MQGNVNENKNVKDNEDDIPNCPRFDPPMSIRRYSHVAEILNNFDHKSLKVVEFGCSELSFLRYVKRMENVHEVAAVDIDECTLACNKFKATPLAADFLCRRQEPLNMFIYCGSMVEKDARLRGYDVVVGIEIIEHLHEEVLSQVPEAIFDFIRPKLAIFTTPNADFNVLFPTLKGFRHWDHKFEWTRKECVDWCEEVIKKYPAYSYTTEGIGEGPPGTEDVGCCSQAAIFRLQDDAYRESNNSTLTNTPYKSMAEIEYPFRKVEQPTEDNIGKELEYFLKVLAKRMEISNEPLLIPIHKLLVFPRIKNLIGSKESLRQLMEKTYKLIPRGRKLYVEYHIEDSDCEENDQFSE